MSNAALTWAWALSIPPADKFVLIAMADLCDDEAFTCYPSFTNLSKRTGYNRASVTRIMGRLKNSLSLVDIVGRKGQNNLYKLNVGRCTGQPPQTSNYTPCATSNPMHLGAQGDSTRCPVHPEVGAQGVTDPSLTHQLPKERESDSDRIYSLVPVDFKPTEQTVNRSRMSGCPKVTDDHINAFVSHYRAKMEPIPDPQEAFIKWMIGAKRIESQQRSSHGNGSRKSQAINWEAKGNEMGVKAKVGESMPAYIARVKAAMEKTIKQ